jgi:hypothetical protein
MQLFARHFLVWQSIGRESEAPMRRAMSAGARKFGNSFARKTVLMRHCCFSRDPTAH